MSRRSGYSLMEVVVALGVFALIATQLVNVIPVLMHQRVDVERQDQLLELGHYVGDYVSRWVNFDVDSKPAALSSFANGAELEGSVKSVNSLRFADIPTSDISDSYKTSIQFWETERPGRALIRVCVWYDKDANDAINSGEPSMNFSTVVSEKR